MGVFGLDFVIKLLLDEAAQTHKGAYFKDDRNFWAFFDPLPPLNAK